MILFKFAIVMIKAHQSKEYFVLIKAIRFLFLGTAERTKEEIAHNRRYHLAIAAWGILLTKWFAPVTIVVGSTSGRGPGEGADIILIPFFIFLTFTIYASRFKGNFKTPVARSLAREQNLRSICLAIFYYGLFYGFGVLHDYYHHDILHLNPFNTIVIYPS